MPKTVLIVDDYEPLRQTLHSWIGSSFPDCRCIEAASGEEAIALSTAESPDVVLIDIELPGVNGIDAIRQMRKAHPAIRFVAMTQYEIAEYESEAKAAGAYICLAKQNLHARLLPMLDELLCAPAG